MSVSRIARPARIPEGAFVVTVGGATLGGSGKTPLALACAKALAQTRRVVVVAHGYGAKILHPVRVTNQSSLVEVGDEARMLARLLPSHVPVVLGRSKTEAMAYAAAQADVILLDGPLQLAPTKATLALLAVDAEQPWGSHRPPPAGDLRAPVSALLSSCDAVISIRDEMCADGPALNGHAFTELEKASFEAKATSRGVFIGNDLLMYEELTRMKVGLVTSLARPDRILRFLRRRGIEPAACVHRANHARGPFKARYDKRADVPTTRAKVDLWVATAKCSEHFDRTRIGAIDYEVRLPTAFQVYVDAVFQHRLSDVPRGEKASAIRAVLDRPTVRP